MQKKKHNNLTYLDRKKFKCKDKRKRGIMKARKRSWRNNKQKKEFNKRNFLRKVTKKIRIKKVELNKTKKDLSKEILWEKQ